MNAPHTLQNDTCFQQNEGHNQLDTQMEEPYNLPPPNLNGEYYPPIKHTHVNICLHTSTHIVRDNGSLLTKWHTLKVKSSSHDMAYIARQIIDFASFMLTN